ncbi:FAD-dependent thymidylate synthase [Halarsenatibacter silvermanii]|uniref:Flavin-dependent thymidylate synthase n=1 Tax=Halarsenatibacter silvermanii TaxID=321763 RepID=A0A1G9SYI6_9FIRM|nr:FAD-dependent thymidylate synthase [Halarsenatibacter silvermanii]SDM40518.1 thymidylate synthase (FAD) [Halarsenatibacter silvermanii]
MNEKIEDNDRSGQNREVKPRAELLDYTEEAEKNVAAAARLCYSRQGAERLRDEMGEEKKKKLIEKVLDLGHYSTLEHSFFSFHIVCSRVASHQLVRQRIGVAYSQRSQRYVSEDNFSYITPPSIEENERAAEKFHHHMDESRRIYGEVQEQDIPNEDARFVLPAVKTNLMASYNARSLYHFFRLRCCRRAQWEIRTLAEQMLAQVKNAAPTLFSRAGPDCQTRGECPEGEMSCGRLAEESEED